MNRNFEFSTIPLNDTGYIGIPLKLKNETYTFKLNDNGCQIIHDSTSAHTFTFDGSAVKYPDGFTVTVNNDTGAGVVTISAVGGLTMYLASDGTTASRSLAANGIATFLVYKNIRIKANGTGLT